MSSVNEWPTVKLGDIQRKVSSINPAKSPDQEFSLYSIPAYDAGAPEKALGSAIKSNKIELQPGDTLLSKIVPHIRRSWIVDEHETSSIGSSEWIVYQDDRLDSRFLRNFFLSDYFHAQFMQTVAGVGGSLNRARPAAVAQISIPIPPRPEQQRIADILDTSAEIIQEEERLQHSILPLAINVVERKITSSDGTLGNLIKSMSSGKNVAESPDPNQKNWVLKVSAVTSGTFKPEESKPLPDTYLPPQSHQVRRGDILVSRANTAQLLGASALVENDVESLYLPDKIWRVTPKDRVDPYLLWGILQTKTVRARISQRATGSSGSMKNISQKNFLQVPCATFSEPESAKLAALIREAVSVHHQIAHKLSLLRSLHNSLSTRAFVGQL